MNVKLRKAQTEDSTRIFLWRNEATTIPWMGSGNALSFDEHNKWFINAVNDPEFLFYIIECDSEPIGQIRYHLTDKVEKYAKVSINITQKMHGKGIASTAFKKGNHIVRDFRFATIIFAHVHHNNVGSIKALENAGYNITGSIEKNNIKHVVMSYKVDKKI